MTTTDYLLVVIRLLVTSVVGQDFLHDIDLIEITRTSLLPWGNQVLLPLADWHGVASACIYLYAHAKGAARALDLHVHFIVLI